MVIVSTWRSFALTAFVFTAQPFVGYSAALADVTTPSGKVIECYCTDRYGQRHELGDIICITVDSRSYMAKCVMAQNNPFWRDQKRGCLSSNNQKLTPFPKHSAWEAKGAQMCG